MDRLENGLSKEDYDSWDIITDDEDDTALSQDFEIIKVLREQEPTTTATTTTIHETESLDDTILKNQNQNQIQNNALKKDTIFTTDDSGETTDEYYYEDNNNKKSKQETKKEHQHFFVEANASKLSTKREHKLFKRKLLMEKASILRKKEENKNKMKKCTNKKSRTLLNSANLGALLTAFGLSLIFLNSSDKTQTNPTTTTATTSQQQQQETTKNISKTLVDAINNTKIWNDESEDKLIDKFLPASINKTLLERKNLKTKLLKRIDRKIKQQIRGCEIKTIKKKPTKTKLRTALIGPVTKDDEFYGNNSSTTSSKPISYRDAVLSNQNKQEEFGCYSKQEESGCCNSKPDAIIDYNVTKTKAEMMNKFLDNDIKKFIQTPARNDEETENKYKTTNSETKKKLTCSSIYRDFIKAEMLFKKILNNSYDIPKPKTPTDLAYNIENKINILTEDNINLSNIIEEQETLLRQIKEKIEYKKEILQKRSQQKNVFQKRLKFANWMKQKRAEQDEQKTQKTQDEQKTSIGEKILNNIVTTTNNNRNTTSSSKSTTNMSSVKYELMFPNVVDEEKYKNKTEEETAIYVKRKLYLLKKHEDLQRNMELKKRKDEDQQKTCKVPLEKSDPKRVWTKKKMEF